ncbi:MAG: hypothetical protein N2234_00165 [Planctomycetota bacterium]|nr:hypothetical protein [Planctomycetota bacterium]
MSKRGFTDLPSIVNLVCGVAITAMIIVASVHPDTGAAGIVIALLGTIALLIILRSEFSREEKGMNEFRKRTMKSSKKRLKSQQEKLLKEEEELRMKIEEEKKRIERMWGKRLGESAKDE